ncbi:MerR family transcriptional regulator [Pacificispira sp.]|uniref:MerR family transcriptional regulator n=1 Tax=Pacificispira sp. TaxID=2888761 RepID=UPI003BACDB24
MKIGELARRGGVSVRMLRFYESEGLLTPVRRSNGYRDFGPDALETVARIKTLKASGMTVPKIRKFLPCALNGREEFEPCDELREILDHQVEAVSEKIRQLEECRDALSDLRGKIDTRP